MMPAVQIGKGYKQFSTALTDHKSIKYQIIYFKFTSEHILHFHWNTQIKRLPSLIHMPPTTNWPTMEKGIGK